MTVHQFCSITLRLTTLVGVFAAGLSAGSPLVSAQQLADTPSDPPIRANIPDVDSKSQVFSITRQVNYADLDLSKPSAVAELEKRIGEAARVACGDLRDIYPDQFYPPVTLHQDCVSTTTDGAMTAAKAIIAAAARK